MSKWDVTANKIIHNETEEAVCLYAIGLIAYEYLPPEAKELYHSLSKEEFEYLQVRLKTMAGK